MLEKLEKYRIDLQNRINEINTIKYFTIETILDELSDSEITELFSKRGFPITDIEKIKGYRTVALMSDSFIKTKEKIKKDVEILINRYNSDVKVNNEMEKNSLLKELENVEFVLDVINGQTTLDPNVLIRVINSLQFEEVDKFEISLLLACSIYEHKNKAVNNMKESSNIEIKISDEKEEIEVLEDIKQFDEDITEIYEESKKKTEEKINPSIEKNSDELKTMGDSFESYKIEKINHYYNLFSGIENPVDEVSCCTYLNEIRDIYKTKTVSFELLPMHVESALGYIREAETIDEVAELIVILEFLLKVEILRFLLNELKRLVKVLSKKRPDLYNDGENSILFTCSELVDNMLKKYEIYNYENFDFDDVYELLETKNEILLRYLYEDKNIKRNSDFSIKSFVLFDGIIENGELYPYVLSDLDVNNKNNLIDDSLEKGKVQIGLQDFSKGLMDIFKYGNFMSLVSGKTDKLSRLIRDVFKDKNGKEKTGLKRLRPTFRSTFRFVETQVKLIPGTKKYEQIMGMIISKVGNSAIDTSVPFVLYLNISSFLKGSNEESYNESIHRFNSSVLYKLLSVDDNYKYTNEELSTLQNAINNSVNAIKELSEGNDSIDLLDLYEKLGGEQF